MTQPEEIATRDTAHAASETHPLLAAYEQAVIDFREAWIGDELGFHAARTALESARTVLNEALSAAPTDTEILEVGSKWAKESGFMDFERNDFISCVRELLAAQQGAAAAAPSQDAEDAGRWRTLVKGLRSRFPGPGFGKELRIVSVCPVTGDENEVNIVQFIDAARDAQARGFLPSEQAD